MCTNCTAAAAAAASAVVAAALAAASAAAAANDASYDITACMIDLIGEFSFEHSMKIADEAAADFCDYF